MHGPLHPTREPAHGAPPMTDYEKLQNALTHMHKSLGWSLSAGISLDLAEAFADLDNAIEDAQLDALAAEDHAADPFPSLPHGSASDPTPLAADLCPECHHPAYAVGTPDCTTHLRPDGNGNWKSLAEARQEEHAAYLDNIGIPHD
eukprot:GHVU01014527.1.p3 GENE.GHVU01014527.1~~GHVU01014527.1.p3  ORF type:complete len:146 (+),score=13.92 GHVU01014527.1:939-1376(+)